MKYSKQGKKQKCSYMMCNIDPSKVMEINVIVWSCQQKKKRVKQQRHRNGETAHLLESEDCQVVESQWRTVINPMDEMCSSEEESMGGPGGMKLHSTSQKLLSTNVP